MGARARLGGWLQRRLDSDRPGFFSRSLERLDEHLNLRYLADRLLHEDAAVRNYLHAARERLAEAGHPNPSDLRISIVSPVYGIPIRYVQRYIRSLRVQTHVNWELCICVDGDPDPRIRRYIDNLAREEPERFRLIIHPVNQGICAATRDAIGLVSGDVVVFADTDDELPTQALSIIAHAFTARPDTDIVYTNHDILTPWGYRIDPVYKPAWSPELLLACNYITHLVAIRASCLARVQGAWSEAVNGCQDWDFLLRATPLARRIHHVPIVLYHWRAIGGSSATRGKPWASEAATRLQDNHLASVDDRLQWNFGDGERIPALEFTAGRAPLLNVVLLGEGEAEQAALSRLGDLPYPGAVRITRIARPQGRLADMAAQLDGCLDGLSRRDESRDALVFFVYGPLAEFTDFAGIGNMAAFASLPGVGCCWPFYGPWRGSYTPENGLLMPRERQTGFFTDWTGNCLTGPLNGLMLSCANWQDCGGFAAAVEGVPEPQPLDALGALLGLVSLGQGRRNVSVRHVETDWRPPVLDLGERTPQIDPYL